MTYLRLQPDTRGNRRRGYLFPARLAAVFLLTLAQVQTSLAAIVNDAVAAGSFQGAPVISPVSSASIDVAPFAPVILVTKTAVLNDDDGNPGITAGDTIDYQMTVRNAGNVNIINYAFSDAQSQNAVSLPLTSGPTYLSGDTVNTGQLDIGETWIYEASYTLSQANLDNGRDIINVAVASGTGMGIGVNGSATVTIDLNQTSGIAVTKTARNANYSTPGETITWDIAVENTGTVTLNTVAVSDPIADSIVCPTSGNATIATLATGATETCVATRTVTAADLTATSIDNTATVTARTPGGVLLTGTDTSSVPRVGADLVTVKTLVSGDATPAEGDTVTFAITVTNNGTADATNVTLTDLIPAGLTPTANNGAVTTGTYAAATGLWTIPTLANGASAVLTIEGTVDTGVTTAVTNTTTAATGDQVDPSTTGDDLTETVTPTALEADLVTVKTLASGDADPNPGDVVTFAITVTNNGPAAATNVSLTDTIPADLNATGNNGAVTAGTYDSTTGVWTIPSLASGESAVLTIEGTVAPAIIGAVTNTTTEATGDQFDPNRAGDDLTETVTVVYPPIDAIDDTLTTPVDSANDNPGVLSLLANDTLNGILVATGLVSISPVGTLPTGFTLNPDGTLDVAQFTAPGTYTFQYQICEVLNPANCDIATVTVPVIRSLPKITGTVFTDINGDGVYNGTDTPLPNYVVQLVQNGVVVATTTTDVNGDYAFESFPPGTYDIVFIDPVTNIGAGLIQGVVVRDRDIIVDQDLPIDPSGVVYDSVTGQPVVGATVTITTANGTPLPAACLLPNQQSQVTGASGAYRFDIVAGAAPECPAGETEYRLTVVPPAGYLGFPSTNIPPQTGTLDASTCPVDAIPGGSCQVSGSDTPSIANPTPYFLAFLIGSGDPNVVNNHIPLDPQPVVEPAELTIAKSASTSVARRGDPVVYTITATNASDIASGPVNIVDRLPAGFIFVPGSATIDGTAVTPAVSGNRLTFTGIDVPANGGAVIRITVRIGASVTPGDYVNEATLIDPATGNPLAPVARATVRVEAEHVFDCGEVIGKVFDDRNRNGIQDAQTSPYTPEPGLPGVRVATVNGVLITTDEHGRFSIPCAEIPDADIGSNFILKLDERTLPSGFRVTTENPRVVRLTRGKVTKLNFGASLQKVVTLNLNANAFVGDTAEPVPDLAANLERLPDVLANDPSLLRLNYYAGTEGKGLAKRRLKAIRAILRGKWESAGNTDDLPVEMQVVAK